MRFQNRRRSATSNKPSFWLVLAAVVISSFALALYWPAPSDSQPAKTAVKTLLAAKPKAPPYRYFATCKQAHAAGRYNIPASDPSYRAKLDGDGDGYACEPYVGRH